MRLWPDPVNAGRTRRLRRPATPTNEPFASGGGGTHLPNNLGAIEKALFGDNPDWQRTRQALRDAYDAVRQDRSPELKPPVAHSASDPLTAPDRCLGRDGELAA